MTQNDENMHTVASSTGRGSLPKIIGTNKASRSNVVEWPKIIF